MCNKKAKTSFIWKIPEEEFIKKVKESNCMSNFQRSIGMSPRGGNFYTVKERIKDLNLSTDHWASRIKASILSRSISRDEFLKTWLTKNNPKNNGNIKKYLLKFNLKDYICEKCGCGPVWDDMPLTLQLDHVNGDRNDNTLNNLRFLCPNCHSQTNTYCGRNNHKEPSKHELQKLLYSHSLYEIKELTKISIDRLKILIKFWDLSYSHNLSKRGKINKNLRKQNAKRRGTEIPSKNVLSKQIWSEPTTLVAKRYNVSDKAIEKWCNQYGIKKPPRGYWTRRKSGMSHEDALNQPIKVKKVRNKLKPH